MSEDTEKHLNLRLLEALLFVSSEPLSLAALEDHLGEAAEVPALLNDLQTHYAERGIHLVEIDGSWSFRTDPELACRMRITKQPRRKLPRAAAEVLAIIAYHQPITRAEIESIRGVETSRGTLDILLELGWVRPGKRRETPGRPLTWNSTPEFLSHFNISDLSELPGIDELKSAGLLDTRPVLATMTTEASGKDISTDDEDFADWIKEESEAVTAE